MGVVHLARRDDGHRVALKVLRPHVVGDDEARARLAREVGSLSRVRSRWVAEIEDADPWGPMPFVATRYVPGLSLHDHVHEEGPVLDLAWFAARLADGLEAVHAVGVLHRDVKPSNVLMEGRAPILIDFGLARVADDPRLTHTGWLLGTPGYLAPEILYGDDATTASDVHSWAATVAYAGLGRPPFGRGPGMAIMDRVRRGQHDLAGLPHELRGLVDAALAPEVLDRPTLHEIRTALEGPPGGPGASPSGVYDAPHADRSEPPPTMPVAAAPTGWYGDESPAAYPPPPPAAPDLATRFRRGLLTGVLLVLLALGTAWAPYPVLGVVLGLAWLLRAGTLSAAGQLDRRARRGDRWYDAALLPLAYPWFFVRATPGLALLATWALGLAVAVGLLAYAFAVSSQMLLGLAGATVGVALWWGPGSAGFSGPVRRLTTAASRLPRVWAVLMALVSVAAFVVAVAVDQSGTSWLPASGPPWFR